jgi:PAS domain S-box-containing protein
MLKDFITNAESAYQSIIITTTGPGYPIIYVNPAFTELNGYSLEEAQGRNANFLRSEDFDHTEQKAKIKTALDEKLPVVVEMVNKHKDGTNLRIELHVFPFYENGECTHFIGVQNDLSFLDNPNYINFFEDTPVAFLRTEIESGKFMMANKACAGLLGYNSVKELMAEEKTSDLYVDKGQRKKLLNKLRKSGRVEGYEVELKLKDGRHIWVSAHLHMNCNGKCIEGTLIDITQHKEMEKKIEEMTESNLFKMQSVSAQLDAKMAELCK